MKLLIFIAKCLSKIVFRIKIYGYEKILKEGPVIVCANHISIWEPVILYLHYPRNIIFLSKKELFEKPILKWLMKKLKMIPVDRDTPNISSIKECINTLKSNEALGIFPQGTRKKTIDEDDGKSGVGFISYKTNAPVQPIYFASNYKLFSKVKIVIGDLIYPEEIEGISNKILYKEFGKKIMKEIGRIGNESNFS